MARKGRNSKIGNMAASTERKGWRTVRFGEVVKNCTESERDPLAAGIERCVGLGHLESECLRIKSWGLVEDGTSFTRRFRKGQVLFAKRRAYQRKVAAAEFDGVCSSDLLVFEPKSGDLIPELLPFIVQSDGFFDHALGTSAGSLSPRTRWSQLRDYEFSLPPLDEQRRIADILWAAEGEKRALAETIEAIDQTELIMVAHILRHDGERGSSKTASGTAGNPKWPVSQLQDVAEVCYGITLTAERSRLPTLRPYLRVANVQRGSLDLSEVKDLGCTDEEAARFALEDGDVLVVEGHADPAEIGRAAVWREQIPGCLHQNHLIRVRCGGELLPEFAAAYLNSPRGRLHFRRFAKSTSGLYTINSTVVRNIRLPVPSVSEQQRVVSLVTSVRQNRTALLNHLDQANALAVEVRRCRLALEE